eukprot:251610-Prymnesium_polylepis.1
MPSSTLSGSSNASRPPRNSMRLTGCTRRIPAAREGGPGTPPLKDQTRAAASAHARACAWRRRGGAPWKYCSSCALRRSRKDASRCAPRKKKKSAALDGKRTLSCGGTSSDLANAEQSDQRRHALSPRQARRAGSPRWQLTGRSRRSRAARPSPRGAASRAAARCARAGGPAPRAAASS